MTHQWHKVAVKLSDPHGTWIESLDSREQKKLSGDVGVSPDTISDRHGSKVAKRFAQAVLPWKLRSPSLHTEWCMHA